ncbi:flagellar basal body P-ring formation chaperone FlgA [Ewingella sp. S1.OA.A_B6]
MNKLRIGKFKRILGLCLGLIPALTLAAPVKPVAVSSNSDTLFAGQIQQFFQQQYASSAMQVKTIITTPAARQPQCLSPQFSLSQNARSWGNVSVAVNCNGQKSYVQAKVQVSGTYWVAARNVSSGAHISANDMQQKSGRLDLLPPRVIIDSQQALNAVTLRNINIGQPLTLSMLRRPWMVHAGQQVQVQATGSGFNVSSAGKAMNNAAAAESVRVRMPSGQIVNGTVSADGTVSIAI